MSVLSRTHGQWSYNDGMSVSVTTIQWKTSAPADDDIQAYNHSCRQGSGKKKKIEDISPLQEQGKEGEQEDGTADVVGTGVKEELAPGQLPALLKPEALEGEEGRLVLSGARAATHGQKRKRAIDVVSHEP